MYIMLLLTVGILTIIIGHSQLVLEEHVIEDRLERFCR